MVWTRRGRLRAGCARQRSRARTPSAARPRQIQQDTVSGQECVCLCLISGGVAAGCQWEGGRSPGVLVGG
eukprot:3818995-Rhodomonas_salina.1